MKLASLFYTVLIKFNYFVYPVQTFKIKYKLKKFDIKI